MSTVVFPRLREVLEKIDRPGSYCVSSSAPVVLPGLEVKDVGPIGLPLTAGQAKELKEHCEQAPYGKGEKTLVDTHVRRVWHLNPEHFTLSNPEWNTFLQQTLQTVQEELGLKKQKLEAHLYDLLLYEKGSFFLPHRDSEKLDRMVATLVIVLPSKFKGGELIVRHEGQEQTIDFTSDDNDPFRIHFAAFYADCEHEIHPLREGYRLCIVYNLTLKKGEKAVSAPRSSEFVQTVAQLLSEWAKDDSARRLAVTLDHQYTQDGLTWDALKGADRFKAQILFQAAQKAGCETALALLTFHECRDAYEEYGYHRRYRRWSDDDEDEGGSADYEVGELIDSGLTAAHWSDPHGKSLPMREITIKQNELVDPESLKDVDPEEEYEGYTGNAGNTLDRWYRHAAIFVWPRRSRFDVLCDAGTESAIESFKPLVEKWRKASGKKAESLREDCIDFARSIITRWGQAGHVGFGQQKKSCALMPLLEALDDPGLVKAYLSQVVVKDSSVEPGKSLAKVCRQHGLATFQRELDLVFQGTTVDTIERNVRLLESVCLATPAKNAESWIASCRSLAETTMAAIEAADRPGTAPDWQWSRVQRAELLAGGVRALLASEQADLLSRLLHHVRAQPNRYPLTSAQVPVITELGPWLKTHIKKHSSTLSDWIAECRKQLEALTAEQPSAPTDYFRAAHVACNCKDCDELKRFLEDPNEKEHHFRYGEGRRRHLEEKIRQGHFDLDCKTVRTGSPHSLVCTKNTKSYQESVKSFKQNQKDLATLRSIQASLPK